MGNAKYVSISLAISIISWAFGYPGDAVSLAQSTGKQEIEQWIARLGEGQPGDNNQATEALIKIGKPAVPYLLAVLDKEPPPRNESSPTSAQWARLRASHCLSQLNYPQIVSILLREIERDPEPRARLIYAIYLTRHDTGKSVESLVKELRKGEYTIPDIVITLKNIRSPDSIPLLRPLLNDSRTDVQLGAAEVLVTLGDSTAEQFFLAQLGGEDELHAALLLSNRHGEAIAPVLRKYVFHPDAQIRLQVAEKLADLGVVEGFETLLDSLQKEPDPYRRGNDGLLRDATGTGKRIISLIGRPDTYDPFGTQALRDKVIDRWRRRWRDEGIAFLDGLKERHPFQGRQESNIGNIHLIKDMPDIQTFFYLAGGKMYEIGSMDGTFPPLGRLMGDQSGIWAHPIKVLDGFTYKILEDEQEPWSLTNCRYFTHQFSSGSFHFTRSDLQATRQDFVAENESAFYSRLTIENKTDRPRKLDLQFSASVNIRPSWRSAIQNDLDIIEYQDGLVWATDPKIENGSAMFGTSQVPIEHNIEDNVVTLTYSVDLPASGKITLTFLVLAGSQADRDRFLDLENRGDESLAQKDSIYQEKIFDGVQFRCSDKMVTDAFYLAKANLLMMSGDIRPYFPASYLYAGIPVYTQLFSNDTSYSIPGAAAAGFGDVARGTLECLAKLTQETSGWVPHETATDGTIVGQGNVQETPQFIAACWKYYQWKGDKTFLEKIYPLCKQSLEFALKRFDQDGDGYLEGTGLIEVSGMGPKKIDGACHLYEAYQGLAGMAYSLGLNEDAKDYRESALALKERFNRDWWNADKQMWADSLKADGSQRLDGYWSVIFPMLTGIADPEKAQIALDRIEREWVNQWGGVHTWQRDISGQGSGVVTTNLFATSAFLNGHADFGWKMLELAAQAPLQERMLGGFVEMIPPGESCFIQLWSFAPFIEAIMEGLAGIKPQAEAHQVEVFPKLPSGLDSYALQNIQIGDHRLDLSHQKDGTRVVTTIAHKSGSVPLTCAFHVLWQEQQKIIVNEKTTHPRIEPLEFIGNDVASVDCIIQPGETVNIIVEQ